MNTTGFKGTLSEFGSLNTFKSDNDDIGINKTEQTDLYLSQMDEEPHLELNSYFLPFSR